MPEYSDRAKTDDAWRKIAAKLDDDAKSVKDKWRNLRTVFLRRYKAEQNGKVFDKTPYYLMERMQFLLPYVKVFVPLSDTKSEFSSVYVPEASAEHESDEHDGNLDDFSGSNYDDEIMEMEEEDDEDRKVYIETVPKKMKPNYGLNKLQDVKLFSTPLAQTIKMPQPHREELKISHERPKQRAKDDAVQPETSDVGPTMTDMNATTAGQQPDNNPRKYFLMSLLPDVNKLTDKQFRKWRKLNLNFLDDCEDD